jgi:hypothetical protein
VKSVLAGLVVSGLTVTGGMDDASGLWTGTVVAEGTVHESGGYHPCKTTIRVRLREVTRTAVAGGYRVELVNDRSSYDVEMAIHGLAECTGRGAELVSDDEAQSAFLFGAKSPAYHLVMPRAFFGFTCGGLRLKTRGRAVEIGKEPPVPLDPDELETSDPEPRYLERNGTLMRGSFATQKERVIGPPSPQNVFRYDYKVTWEIHRSGGG